MAVKRRRRKNLDGKYVARRFFLVLLLTVLVVGGAVYLGYWLANNTQAPPVTEPAPLATTAPTEPPATTLGITPIGTTPQVRGIPVVTDPTEPTIPAAILEDWNLLLVNPTNTLPENFSVELEKAADDFRVDTRIRDELLRMMAHAREDGVILTICSAYRSPEYQTTLFENKKTELMNSGKSEPEAIATTATIIAVPGTSEHHTGLAVDIVTPEYQSLDSGFENTPAFQWLSQHSAEYGFVMRYPKDKRDITEIIYEPWHYRYVGVEHAAAMNEQKMCLEEYVAYLHGRILAQNAPTEAAAADGTDTAATKAE